MAFLLDTCAIIWSADPKDRLPERVREILSSPDERFYVSAVSVGEIACLQLRKRLELPTHWKPWFRETLRINGWDCLPVAQEELEEAYSLPEPFHPDPVDRMLVATARLRGLTLLTADRKILDYPHVKTQW